MQTWIPVVSSSLYFWKSVFGLRADSILKSEGDFISNWKFPDCVHFSGAWARQAVIETIAVVYELTKKTQEKLFADWAQLYKVFFVQNEEPASAWIFGNSSVRIGTQGFFCPNLKTFVTSFFLTRLTAPGSPSGFLCALVLIWPFYRRVRYSVGRSTLSCYHGVHGQRWRAFSDTILFLAKSIGTLI